MDFQISPEDGRITETTFTIIGKKNELRDVFNLFQIDKLTLDDHLQFYNTLLNMLGFNFLNLNYFKGLSPVIGFFNIFQHAIILISSWIFIRENKNDLGKVLDCATTQLFGIVILLKIFILYYQRHNINDLVSRIRYEYTEIMNTGGTERKILLRRFLEGRIVSRFFQYATFLTMILFSMVPIISPEERTLPFPASSFYLDRYNLKQYILDYFLQMYAMMYSIHLFSAYEAFCIYTVMMLCSKIEILQYKIKQFGTVKEFYKFSEPGSSESSDLCLMDMEYAEAYIVKIIKAHQSIYRLAEDFNKVYQYDFFIELVFSGIIGCLSLYQITEKSGSDIIAFCSYLGACITQIFVFCWYGDLIHQKSSELPRDIYLTNWYLMCPSLRKTFHIILMRSQKVINVSAIFANLTLEVFTQVMRGMYSFYTILVQTD